MFTVIAIIMVVIGIILFSVGYLGQVAAEFSKKNKKSVDKH